MLTPSSNHRDTPRPLHHLATTWLFYFLVSLVILSPKQRAKQASWERNAVACHCKSSSGVSSPAGNELSIASSVLSFVGWYGGSPFDRLSRINPSFQVLVLVFDILKWMVTMRTTSCRAPILLFFCVWTHTSPPKKCAFHVYLLTGHLSAPVEVVKALKVICIKTNAPSDQRLWGTSSVLTLKTYKLSVFSMMSFSWFLGQYFSINHSNFIGNYIAIFVGAPAGALMLPKEKT